jgi:hypothetical protein
MICFEEFHTDAIYPVVLPCGHTYVCNNCADRLDKCMECRTPLYTIVPRGPSQGTPQGQNSSPGARFEWSSARSGGNASRGAPGVISSPPQPPIKKRLPLPKNVVLLSLIEATELATQDVQKKYSGSPSNKNTNGNSQEAMQSMGSMLDAEDDEDADDAEEEKIKAGTSLATSVAGTYAVAHREGLDIFPSRPSALVLENSGSLNDEDVDALVRFFHLDTRADSESVNSKTVHDPARLSFGDRVQIVSVEGGWAKLARGYGYVRADRNQLVKGTFFSIVIILRCPAFSQTLTVIERFLNYFLHQSEVQWIAHVNSKLCSWRCQTVGRHVAWNRAKSTTNSFN